MKICLPTLEDTGLEAALCGHFGQAPFFTLVDADTNQVMAQPNRGTQFSGNGERNTRPLLGVSPVFGLGHQFLSFFQVVTKAIQFRIISRETRG